MMDFDDPPPQAVPTLSVSSSGANYSYVVPNRQPFGLAPIAKSNHERQGMVPKGSATVEALYL